MGVGIGSMFGNLGLEIEAQVNTDSSTARSILSMRGAGRVRHVEVRELWVQEEKVRRGELSIIKVKGGDNVDEGLAKHADRNKLEKYMKLNWFIFLLQQ